MRNFCPPLYDRIHAHKASASTLSVHVYNQKFWSCANSFFINTSLQVALLFTCCPLAVGAEVGGGAVGAIRTGSNLARLRAAGVALIAVADLVVVLARVGDLAGVTVVGVDAAQNTAALSNDTVNDNVTGTSVARAVTTAANKFTVVVGIEVLDLDSSTTVELDDLVLSLEGTTAIDV